MSRGADFWSRRKAGVQAEAAQEAAALAAAEEEAQAEALRAEQAEQTDAEILASLDLPDPDSLQPGDDFSGFMTKAVPEHLRRRALRKLWRSNPVLACLDDLVDYADDYTDAATVVKDLQTSYIVGKGLSVHVEEMARKAAEAAKDTLVEAIEASDAEVAAEAPTEEPLLAEAAPEAQAEPAPDHMAPAAEPLAPPARRRMAFHFTAAPEGA
ncbi:DUF3306 domain-containing protein [Pseudoruegeria sp. SHC-113]|uniref:DUF3306 domain-containing protein n=1 Tax=Pseudoruegeria sp. SHC-113 TaxID=2855439 RepID=UPI0021BA5BB5|nr:DUF3306 domain-containing protein [Pseudoruegeria sp. SHC-113]MCT8159247.1 DUF3306 domain-containing protein [Pseudoruegeria sp. SHC-113]